MDARVKSVFISHSSRDKLFVNRLVSRLRENGVTDLWYDVLELGPNAELNDEITAGIRRCDVFAIVLSPASQGSPWVSYEVQEAMKHGKEVLAIVADAPDGHYDFLRNPHTNDLLRGGRRKVIDFAADFENGLNQVLLAVAPDVGRLRVASEHLRQILESDDPDEAERAMSFAALDPQTFLGPLLAQLPELRNDPRLRHRVSRAMVHLGAPALRPLLAKLLLMDLEQAEDETPPAPAVSSAAGTGQAPEPARGPAPGRLEPKELYTGSEVTDMLRLIILTGGNRGWAAQIGAQKCLIAMAEADVHMRTEIRNELSRFLEWMAGSISVDREVLEFTDDLYDALRMAIETVGLIERPSQADPFLILQFATTALWGEENSEHAKDKLVSYVVPCLASIGTRKALHYLLQLMEDEEVAGLFFARARHPNPWDECFLRFGNEAVDPLIKRLEELEADDRARPSLLRNLASITHPRALSTAVAKACSGREPLDEVEAVRVVMAAAGCGLSVICDSIADAYLAGTLFPGVSEMAARYLEEAAGLAALGASTRDRAAAVCERLRESRDAWTISYVLRSIGTLRIYSMLDFAREALDTAPSGVLRGIAAITLADLREVAAADLAGRLAHAEQEVERPYLSLALARLGDPAAIPGLVDGLKQTFRAGNWAEHDRFAEALTGLGTPEAQQASAKWHRRI
jgi:hypothetical protein